MITTVSEHLNTVICKDVDRSHRAGKFDPAIEKAKISHSEICHVRHRVFANKQKLKGKGISISESLTRLSLVKLNEAREQLNFGNVWYYDGKLCPKTATTKSIFLWLKGSHKKEAGPVAVLVRVSSEGVRPVRYPCDFIRNKL